MDTGINSPTKRGATPDDRFSKAYCVLDDAIAAGAFPGCAFGVLAGGNVVLQDARGHFTYEQNSPAVAASTVFDIASVSKVVATTAIAMLLHQRGRLDINTLLGDILPDFLTARAPEDPARGIRLRHLLAHSSGLPAYVEFFKEVKTPDELLHACLRLSLEARPGERGYYSDPGFILLGKALDKCMGETLDAFARHEIFDPLGMEATRFCPSPQMRAAIPPTENDTTFRNRCIQGEVQDENAYVLGGVAGHAGLFSNVPNILRFAGEILDATGDSPAQTNLFQATTIEMFGTRAGPAGSSRALGWDTPSVNSSSGQYFSPHSIGHLGYSGCSLWIDLDARIAIVLLTNRTWPDRKSQLIRQVRPAFHDAVRQAF